MSNQEILATVAGEQITEKDLNTFIQNLPKEQQMYAANPQFRQQVLDQMINNRLFAKYAEEIGGEVLATAVENKTPEGYTKEWNINGEKVTLGVERQGELYGKDKI